MTTRSPKQTEIVYPESDGMPMPDAEYQAPIFRRVVMTLEGHFRDRHNTRVNGNTFLYYEEGNPRRVVSPDCYVAFDVDVDLILHFNTYRLWEMGKPPDFILEIASPSTAANDLGRKRDLYARIGVGEYWRYDATGGSYYGEPMVGEYLADGEYHRFEIHREAGGAVWSHSPALNLDLHWNPDCLQFYDLEAGAFIPDYATLRRGRQAAQERADTAEARVLELEAELRRLRGE